MARPSASSSSAPPPMLPLRSPSPAKPPRQRSREGMEMQYAHQQPRAHRGDHRQHRGEDRGQHRHQQQQWQQEQQIHRRESGERQQRRGEIAEAAMALPAPEPAFGAQLAGETAGIAERARDIFLAPSAGARLVEIGGVVGEDVLDLRSRHPREPLPEQAQEHLPVHSRSPSKSPTAATKPRHSRFCACSAARPRGVRR